MDIAERAKAVRDRVDLVALIGQDVQLRRSGPNEWRGRNPFHGGDNPTGLAIYHDRHENAWKFKAFTGQGYQGDVIDYIRYREGCEFLQALERLEGGANWSPRRPVESVPAAEAAAPLDWSIVERYQRLLDLPIDPSGRNPQTPREWWHAQGMDDDTIEHYKLGFCPACPTAFDPDDPKRTFASAAIPITFGNELLAIRHRLIAPADPQDKYRPHRKGAGLHLFNRDSLIDADEVLIVEGEKKAMMLHRCGVDSLMGVVSSTGGVKSWLGRYQQIWCALLANVQRVYVLFDPGSEEVAEQTAYLFGRRGHTVTMPEKVDDYLLADPDPIRRLPDLFEAIGQAPAIRSRSYWGAQLERERDGL